MKSYIIGILMDKGTNLEIGISLRLKADLGLFHRNLNKKLYLIKLIIFF